MVFEPFAGSAVIRVYGFYFLPKSCRVVHMGQMAKLMYHYVVQNGRWRQHESPVERERSSGTAASPSCLLITDGNAVVFSAGKLLEISSSFGKIFFGGCDISLFQGGPLYIGQIGDRPVLLLLLQFQVFGDDPDPLFEQKTGGLMVADTAGSSDCDLSIRGYTDGAAFAVAANQRVGQFIELALVLDPYSVIGTVCHIWFLLTGAVLYMWVPIDCIVARR